MSQVIHHRSLTTIRLGVTFITVCLLIVIGRVAAGLTETTVVQSADVEAKAYLPLITNIGSASPSSPILILPNNGEALQTLIPTFVWDMGSHPMDVNVMYCLTFSPDEDEIDGCWSSGGPSNGIVERTAWFNFEANTVYFWRVGFIYDYDYDDIQWSETRTLTTGPSGGVMLSPPLLESPDNGSLINAQDAILNWADVPGSIMYSVTIHDIQTDRWYGWDVSESQLNVSEGNWWTVEPGGEYEWSVSVRNDYAWSDESETRTFSVLPSSSRSLGNRSLWTTILRTRNGFTRYYGK